MEEKDFDTWNIKKKAINKRDAILYFKEREIWWCSLGCNVGSEEDGKNDNFERPILIFRIFGTDILWVIPLTTQLDRENSRITYKFNIDGVINTADISQLKLISKKRLLRYIGLISFEDFQNIRNYFRDLY